MDKEMTYQEKFALLDEWASYILEQVKKDLRNHHLKHDQQFVKRYFPSKNFQKLGTKDLVDGYKQAIQDPDSGEKVGEFISDRWLLKHTDVYNFFEQELSRIHTDFTKLETIEDEKAYEILHRGIPEFGLINVYLFAVLNSVVFSQKVYDDLAEKAKKSLEKMREQALSEEERLSYEALEKKHQQEKARLTNRYEKKLAGFEKKYDRDIEMLKKQIALLQSKLRETAEV